MPTQSTTYNSRVTDEALEKRFRDTFRSQGGAELVDDLYAQGVIVPIVDFTAAASGQSLSENLQTAWDFSVTHLQAENGSQTLASNAGFYKCSVTVSFTNAAGPGNVTLQVTDGVSTKILWRVYEIGSGSTNFANPQYQDVVFLRAGDSLQIDSSASGVLVDGTVRQIATVSGDLVNPSGFTSS